MLKAEETVRRTGARMVTVISMSTTCEVGAVNALAKGVNDWMRTGAGAGCITAQL